MGEWTALDLLHIPCVGLVQPAYKMGVNREPGMALLRETSPTHKANHLDAAPLDETLGSNGRSRACMQQIAPVVPPDDAALVQLSTVEHG